jgi:hypothetical protein
MTLKGNYFQTNVSPLVDARDERRRVRAALSANITTGGVYQPGDFAVAQVGAGTTMQVQIGACTQGGGAVVLGQDTHQGAYFAYSDAIVTLPIAAADPTNPRIDVVILRIYDDEITPGTGFSTALEIVRGTPAASPAVPALPRDCIALAQVRVNVGQTGITTAAITDVRRSALTKPWGVAWGEQLYYSTPAGVSGIGSTPVTLLTTPAFTAITNRVYVFEFYCGAIIQNGAAGQIKVQFTDNGGALIGGLLIQMNRNAGERCSYTPAAQRFTGVNGPYKVRPATNAGTVDFVASVGNDPGPIVARVVDAGPLPGSSPP